MASFNEDFAAMMENELTAQPMTYIANAMVVLTTPVLMLIRTDFGERYLSTPVMALYIAALCVIGNIGNSNAVHWGFTGLLAFMMVYHLFCVWNRNRKNIRWHSRYDGNVFILFRILPVSQAAIKLWVEPFFAILISSLLVVAASTVENINLDTESLRQQPTSTFISFWFVLAAPFMVLLEKLQQSAARDRMLDVIDSQIEVEQMNDALEGEPAKETEGFVVRGISDVAPRERKKMVAILKKGAEDKMKKKGLVFDSESSVVPSLQDRVSSSLPAREPA